MSLGQAFSFHSSGNATRHRSAPRWLPARTCGVLTTDGDLIVAPRDAAKFTPLRRYEVSESATWSHPALMGSRLLVRDAANLTLWTAR